MFTGMYTVKTERSGYFDLTFEEAVKKIQELFEVDHKSRAEIYRQK